MAFALFPRLTFRAAWRSLCRNMEEVQREAEEREEAPVVAIQAEVQVGLLGAAPEAADVATVTIDGAPQNILFVAPRTPPVAAVVMWTRDSRLVCVTFGSSTMVGMRARWSMAG